VPESFVAEGPKVEKFDPEEVNGQNFPPEARALNIEGTVLLRLGIDRHGSVRTVKVIKPAGYGFDEAAVKAVKRYKWKPARDNKGEPVDMLITYKYNFRPPQ
jgi:protein TonB